jgi:hypothetical protein
MRIEVNEDKTRIVGYCVHPAWNGEDLVLTLHKNFGIWSIGTSRTLPVDVESAKIVLECMNKAFAKMEELS